MRVERILENDDRKFLLQSIKLCKNIDAYMQFLGLDSSEVANFKNEVELFLYIANHCPSFTESFILYNINTMRRNLAGMVFQCTRSKNYSYEVGEALGIATARHSVSVSFPELGFLIGIQK